ncbi:MAG: putative secreted protein [Candidatus Phytoplasma solani]
MYLKKRYFLLLSFLFIPLFFTSVFATNNVKSVKVKKIYYKPNNTIDHYYIYEYNTQGQLIKKLSTTSMALFIVITFMNTTPKVN